MTYCITSIALLLLFGQSSATISSTAMVHDDVLLAVGDDANNNNNKNFKGEEEILPSPSFADLEASWKASYFEKESDSSSDDNDNDSSIVIYEEESAAPVVVGDSCASIMDCRECSNTYSCHWCDGDNACHARGSIYGCNWGSSCSGGGGDNNHHDHDHTGKENSTCAAQTTCSDCALSSRLCHWCEHDQACHAKGSIYGCSTGVDCYSNDRCRRKEPEKFSKFVVTEIPKSRLILVVSIAALLIMCCSTCHYCVVVRNVNDDQEYLLLSRPPDPPSITDGAADPSNDADDEVGVEQDEEAANPGRELQEIHTTTTTTTTVQSQQQEQNNERGQATTTTATTTTSSNYVLMDEVEANEDNQESSPLISHLSFDAASSRTTEITSATEQLRTRHRHQRSTKSTRLCTWLYYISVASVLFLLAFVIVFFPKRPVYNVCNDAVAWKHIFEQIAKFQVNLGFEILISLKNPNRLDVALDNATGSFTFEGRPVGTFQIPPDYIDSMSITDVMLITHVTPDKYQAMKMADAYLINHDLILTAEFDATLRVPALMNYTRMVHVENITVYVNELSDRSLCNCPTWDDEKNRSAVNQNLINLF